MSSFTTFVRAILVVGSFAAVAPVTGCAAQVGDGHEETGATSEAIANCSEGDPTCSIFGSTPKGCALNPGATGCPGALVNPTCNPSTECCTAGGETLANIQAGITSLGFSASCGQKLIASGCGGVTSGKFDPNGITPAVASSKHGTTTSWWFGVFCPTSLGTPVECTGIAAAPWSDAAPSYAENCEGGLPFVAGYTAIVVDPTGCGGGTCKTIVKSD